MDGFQNFRSGNEMRDFDGRREMREEFNRRMEFDRGHEMRRREEFDRRHDFDVRLPFWWLLFR